MHERQWAEANLPVIADDNDHVVTLVARPDVRSIVHRDVPSSPSREQLPHGTTVPFDRQLMAPMTKGRNGLCSMNRCQQQATTCRFEEAKPRGRWRSYCDEHRQPDAEEVAAARAQYAERRRQWDEEMEAIRAEQLATAPRCPRCHEPAAFPDIAYLAGEAHHKECLLAELGVADAVGPILVRSGSAQMGSEGASPTSPS